MYSSRILLVSLVMCAVMATTLFEVGQCDEQKPEGGFRNWIGNLVRGITTTTTTTPKPNIFNRAQSFYKDTKDKVQIVLDPKKALKNSLSQALSG